MARHKFLNFHNGNLLQTLFVVLNVGFNVIQSVEYNYSGLFKVSFKSEQISL